jgi:putative glutamine amidotransferase
MVSLPFLDGHYHRFMPRPIIGITCSRSVDGRWSDYSIGHFMEFAFDAYSQAVLNCGGAPLLVPISQDKYTLAAICGRIDGLILTGGPDINPRFYKEEPRHGLMDVDEAQDRMELELTRRALDAGLPVLGICRGLQVLNVAMGGTLVQDIPRQVPEACNHSPRADRSTVSHKVRIEPHTHLQRILQRRSLWVNSKHHQAVNQPAPGLSVCAVATDGIIEALEAADHPYVLAVQWHPEGLWQTDAASRKLFKSLIAAAGQGLAQK